MTEATIQDTDIEPVWNRIPSFFAYPFKPRVFSALVGLTLIYALAFLPIPVISLVIFLLAWMAVYKYAYEVLAMTAAGHMDAPDAGYVTATDFVAFKHVGLMLIMMLASTVVALWTGSPLLTWMTIAFFVLAWPAAIITLAMTSSLLAALNPATWVSVITRIGWPYLAASGFLLLMEFSEAAAEWVLVGVAGGMGLVLQLAAFLLGAYFLVASFHLMGYLVYQHHAELGVEVDEDLAAADSRTEDERLVAESRALIQDGRVDEALAMLGENLRSQGGAQPVHDQYRKLLALQDDRDRLLSHGREYIGLLLHGFQDARRAVQVADECLRLDGAFEPAEPDQVRELAARAEALGLAEVALKLTEGFGDRHPRHRDAAENQLIAARILSDRYGEDQRALDILRELQRRYPEHPMRAQIDEQAALLKRLVASAPPGG